MIDMVFVATIEKFICDAIDKSQQAIKNSYDKIEKFNDFTFAYDDAMNKYKQQFGEDTFFKLFYAEELKCREKIQEFFDQPILARELHNDILNYIASTIENEFNEVQDQLGVFLGTLFANLLHLDTYREKIFHYRQDLNLKEMLNIIKPEILDICKKSCNEFYTKYTKKLPLEKNDLHVKKIEDVYVKPLCKFSYNEDETHIEVAIEEFLKKGNHKQVMLITANAGMGKTTLLSKCTYDYIKNGHLYGFQKVFLIKLGSLNADTSKPLETIGQLLKIDDLHHFNDSLILLDAYDELQGAESNISLFFDALRKEVTEYENCKVIITSRLNYITIPTDYLYQIVSVELLPFNQGQRKEWLDKYGKHITCYDYLVSALEKEETELMGIPLVLYFIAHDNLNVFSVENKYDLYNRLFGIDAIKDRVYSTDIHTPLYEYSEELYELMLEIALYMFRRNTDLQIDKPTIESGIFRKLENWKAKEPAKLRYIILKYCGISSFFNNKGNDVLEFIHKSIYEYYLATIIFRELVNIIERLLNDKEECLVDKCVDELSELFLYAELTPLTLEFIYYQIERGHIGITKDTIASYSTKTILRGLKRGLKTHQNISLNFIKQIKNVFTNSWRIYNVFMNYNGYNDILNSWFTIAAKRSLLYDYIILSDFKQLFLNQLELDNVNFVNWPLSEAKFCSAKLCGAKFDDADCREADFRNAVCQRSHFREVDFRSSICRGADFTSAYFFGTDCTKADFRGAIFQGANCHDTNFSIVKFQGADFQAADFRGSKFSGANCLGAKFQGADCICTDFRDVCFYKAKFQKANCIEVDFRGAVCHRVNFRELKCIEAKFQGAKCLRADFRGADFHNADFEDSDCRNADFRNSVCTCVNFKNVNLRGADFRGTVFQGVDLRGAKLKGTNFSKIILVCGYKIKVSLTQLTYMIIDSSRLDYFEVYKDDYGSKLAEQSDIDIIVKKLKKM